MKSYRKTATAIALGFFTVFAIPIQSIAQDYGDMSCSDLWYARNAIYAAKGFCFKTEQGRQAFGRNCFPPYGKLTARETRDVRRIETWERRSGCR